MRNIIIFLTWIIINIQMANARPVSYPEGWTSMLMNNGDRNALHLHYSPTAKYSIGYKFEYWREDEYSINAIQVNNLLKRWNAKEWQANLYLKSGLGFAHSDKGNFDNEIGIAGFTGIGADWENRRFFTSYENRYTKAGEFDKFYMQSARIGIAPYIGDYGDLHTWLILDAEHKPTAADKFTITPTVRLFKGSHMVETGISDQGDFLFNWVARY